MRKFTKSLMTLGLLLVAGVASAKETVVFSMDYSTQSTYPFWGAAPDGSSFELADGMLVIKNTKKQDNAWDLQIDLAEGFSATAGLDYKVNIVYKTTANGKINLGMGTLTGDIQYEDRVNWYDADVTAKDDFQTFTWNISPYTNTNAANHVIWQCGSLIATVYIKSIEIIEITKEGPSLIFGSDLVDVAPTIYVKNYGGDATAATPDADGVYTVTDEAGAGDSWAAQFWIAGEYALPAGNKFKVEFDYKADNAGTVSTQTHAATPGSYIIWYCIGDVSFKTDWDHFEKEVDVESDMGGWQSIAFNMHLNSNTKYYIKNIVLKEPKVVGETFDISVGTVGWASFSYTKDLDLGTAKGYAAKYNGSYIELTPVTEVPANNAVLIEGAGKHSFPVIASAAAISDNDLKVSDGSITGDGSTIYVLANKDKGVGFYKLTSGQKVPAGKAYLTIGGTPAPDFLGFDGGTTSISEKTVVKNNADGEFYNLAGQRVAQPTKGLYIVNGKKVIK